jgi:hypothetical protein
LKTEATRSNLLRFFLGLAISLLFLWLSIRGLSWNEIWDALRQADPAWVLLALLVMAANTLLRTLRWQTLLNVKPDANGEGEPVNLPASQVRFRDLLMSLLAGQMINTVLPVRLGDLSRAYVIGGKGPGRAFVLGTVGLEKVLDLFWYGLLFGFTLLLIPLPGWLNSSAGVLIGGAALLTAATVLIAFQRERLLQFMLWATRRLPDRASQFVNSRLRAALVSLDALHNASSLIWMSIWSGAIWLTAILTNQLALLALDIHLDLSASLLLLLTLQAGVTLVTVPGRIGIFEYICILTLSLYGIDRATALSYGFLLHGIVFIPITLLGTISFFVLGLSGKRKEILLAGQEA